MEEGDFARKAEHFAGKGDVLLIEGDMASESVRRLCAAVMDTCGGRCAVFAGSDSQGYKYAVGQIGGDLRSLVKDLNTALNGRGGGKPHFARAVSRPPPRPSGPSSRTAEPTIETLSNSEGSVMKYLRQALIIAAITFAAEIVKYLLPLPIPVSIYGLAMLFFLLKSGLLALEQVQDVGNLLLELMPLLLVPASVSFITALDTVQAMLRRSSSWALLGTLLVMAVTGLAAQWVIRGERRTRTP